MTFIVAIRAMVLSLAVLIVSALPAQATIFMNTDGWTEESIQNEWNGFSDRPVWVYSFTSSDDPEYPYLGVQTAFRDPSGNVIGSGWGEGYGDASAYITYYDNPDSGVEGTFGADSEHWDTGGTIDFSFFGFGVRNVASRYSYYGTETSLDPGGQICYQRFVFRSFLCYGDCQLSVEYTPWFPGFQGYQGQPCTPIDQGLLTPPRYLQGTGKRWMAWWGGFCQMNNRASGVFPICKP